MSPVPTATRAERAHRTDRSLRHQPGPRYEPAPADLPADAFRGLGKEIVVDWQLPSDMERTT